MLNRISVLLVVLVASALFPHSTAASSAMSAENRLELTAGPTGMSAQSYYYIGLNGTDPSDCSGGTQSNPWRTWTKAEMCISPGSTVYFVAGSYLNIFAEQYRRSITFRGAEGQPITIKPAPGAEGEVYFNQTFSIFGAHGVISGIDIYANSSYQAISIYQGNDILLEDNKIHGSRIYGCVHIHANSDTISLVGNEIYDCGVDPQNTRGRGDAVDTTGGTNLVYRANHIHDA